MQSITLEKAQAADKNMATYILVLVEEGKVKHKHYGVNTKIESPTLHSI